MSENLVIDKSKTALLVIDLQKDIITLPSRQYTAGEVISNAAELVNAFRKNCFVFTGKNHLGGKVSTSLKRGRCSSINLANSFIALS
jgi:nicotinamidase-related amidase